MLPSDQKTVERIVKDSGSSFYWGMRCLPEFKRRAMFSIYAFCRVVDDIADEKSTKLSKKKQISLWVNKIHNLYKHKDQKTSLLRELRKSIDRFNLEKNDFLSIIKGMQMDINENILFPETSKLKLYCERVAVAVGFLSIDIFQIKKKFGKKYAYSLGMAFQLTNIVRDFKEDLEIKRCYIPKEKLEKFRIKKKLDKLENDPKIQKVLQEILKEAHSYFKKSDDLAKKISKSKITAPEIMKLFYKKIHKKMWQKKIDFEKKIKLNFFDKILIMLKFLIR